MLKDLSIMHLGQFIDLSLKVGECDMAQRCLDEIQSRIPVQAKPSTTCPQTEPIPIPDNTSEPQPGPVISEDGTILMISVLPGERGYGPEAHEMKLKIFCDDTHIETAHTADVEAGIVKYYEKNAKGRVKTKEKHGKVEIRGYSQ